MPSRFLLIDDHPLLREGLALALGRVTEDVEVFEAGSCERGLEIVASQPDLDLIVLDMQLPGLSRLDAVRALREAAPAVPLVVLSAETASELVHGALRAGARGYIAKSSPREVMIAAFQMVFAGGVYIPPTVLDPPATAERPLELTRRQEQVLVELARGHDGPAIAARLGVAEATVRVHVATILRVLRVDTREQAIHTALARELLRRAGDPA